MAEEKKERIQLKVGNIMLETTKVLPVVLSLVVIVVAILGFQLIRSGKLTNIEFQPATIVATTDTNVSKRLQSLEDRVSELSDIINTSSQEMLASIGLDKVQASVKSVSSELDALKVIIVENPEKALAIPLLRKEMDELEHKHAVLAVSTKDQIDRIYDFSKWFLGLMITLAIGLITMGFVRRPKGDN